MHRQKFYITFLIVAMFTVRAFAFDNNFTHPYLTNVAVDLLISKDASFAYLGNYSRFNIKTNTQLTFLDEGSVKEDNAINPDWNTAIWGSSQDSSVPSLSWKSHGYNPRTGETWYGMPDFKNAYLYSGDIWTAITTKPNKYFQIGRLCHMIEDMASPSHANGDMHVDGDDIEEYSMTNYSNITFPRNAVKKPSTDGLVAVTGLPHPTLKTDNAGNFMQNVAWRTYYMTSFYGGKLVQTEGDRQPDSELKRMFPYSKGGLRYDDGGWFSNDSYVINNVGNNWIGWGIGVNPEWWECPSDPGYFYLENIDGDDSSSTGSGVKPAVFKIDKFRRVRSTDNFSTVLAPNSKIFMQLYLESMYTLAVEWTAGFIKFAAK